MIIDEQGEYTYLEVRNMVRHPPPPPLPTFFSRHSQPIQLHTLTTPKLFLLYLPQYHPSTF